MAKELTTKTSVAQIHSTSQPIDRVVPQMVGRALGTDVSNRIANLVRGGPLTLIQVRQELFQRLKSTGGRPSLSGISDRKKIPIGQDQWSQLEAIAGQAAKEGFTPSAGQVASVLISLSLESLKVASGESDATLDCN